MHKWLRLLRYDWPLHAVLRLTNWLPDNVPCIRLRGRLARPFFGKCGGRLGIGRNVTFYDPSKITIGDWVYIAYGSWFSASAGLHIADEVLFGPYTVVATTNHTRLDGSYRFGEPRGKAVTIGRGVWIGAHCSILRGARIGSGTVIAANTVVRGEVPPDCIYGSQDAEVKRSMAE